MEGNLDPRMEYSWRWRPETAVGRNWADKQGRFGPEGANRMLDFQDVREWTDILPSGDRVGV
jgi:sarcosine oxidase/L-pipecolate oxidase